MKQTRSLFALVVALCLLPMVANAYVVKQSSIERPLMFKLFQASSSTPYTSGSPSYALPTVLLSKNGAAFAAPAGAVTIIGDGWFQVAANATDDNTLGVLTLYATAPSADESDTLFEVAAYDPQDGTLLGLSNVGTLANQTSELTQVNKIGLNTGDSPNSVTAQTNAGNAATQTTATALGTAVWATPASRTITGGTAVASNFVAAPTVAQVAAGILATPANLLATNATGQVAASNLPTDYLNTTESTNLANAASQTTAASLAAGVWNAVSASYAIAGSTGAKLAAAGSAGDPWATLLTSESTAGSFGATVKANLDTNVGSRLAAGNVTVGGYAAGQDPATLMFAASFVTIPTTHTTTGVSEVLTWKQFEALSDATLGGDNTTTSPNVVASGTATVTYYLRGQAKVAASVVAVSTVTYDSTKNQIGRQILIAQPFPTVN